MINTDTEILKMDISVKISKYENILIIIRFTRIRVAI